MRKKLLQILQALSKLENNWDGYNAKPLTKQVLQDANDFLSQLPDNLLPCHCGPSADNEIIFEWRGQEPIFIISMYGNGLVHCFGTTNPKTYLDDVPIDNFQTSEIYLKLKQYVGANNAGQYSQVEVHTT